jgi:hypothetical protein
MAGKCVRRPAVDTALPERELDLNGKSDHVSVFVLSQGHDRRIVWA